VNSCSPLPLLLLLLVLSTLLLLLPANVADSFESIGGKCSCSDVKSQTHNNIQRLLDVGKLLTIAAADGSTARCIAKTEAMHQQQAAKSGSARHVMARYEVVLAVQQLHSRPQP
jgi:hypothetical protein